MTTVDYKLLGNGLSYDKESVNDIVNLFNNVNVDYKDKVVASSKIIAIEKDFVIVRVNDKFDSVIKKSELKDLENIELGMLIDVFIEKLGDKKGQIVVSRTKGLIVRIWEEIFDSKKNNTILLINIKEKVAGGVIGEYKGVKVFVPMSQIINCTNDNLDTFIGKDLEVIVVKINKVTCNVIAYNKLVLEVKKKDLEHNIVDKIQPGQIIECVVSNIVPYGAFVSIGGVDFLLHINEISWRHIDSPDEVLKIGDVIKVAVLTVNKDTKKLGLSLKCLENNPWDDLKKQNIKVGDIFEGKVINILDYGIFVEVLPGIEGLVHISEIAWNSQNVKISKLVKVNELVKVKVIDLDIENKRIGLSIKQLTEDPWMSKEFDEQMKEGSIHEAEVIEIKQCGCIVKLDNNLESLVHVSDFSWTQRVNKVEDFVKKGDHLKVVVLNVNKELRKISCGIKQITKNPWEEFAGEFNEGSIHEGTVIKKTSRGYILKFEHDLEGLISKDNIVKGKTLSVGSKIEVMVIEFSVEDAQLHVADKEINFNLKANNEAKMKSKKLKFSIGDALQMNKDDEI